MERQVFGKKAVGRKVDACGDRRASASVVTPPGDDSPKFVGRRTFLAHLAAGLVTASTASPLAGSAKAVEARGRKTYTNPVWSGSMPDPFVLRHRGVYYAFGTTGPERTRDGRIFTLLRSTNLVDWKDLGGALVATAAFDGQDFWAPEVAERDGTFFLYYSMGGREPHTLRPATARRGRTGTSASSSWIRTAPSRSTRTRSGTRTGPGISSTRATFSTPRAGFTRAPRWWSTSSST
jgi:hypothetical protein